MNLMQQKAGLAVLLTCIFIFGPMFEASGADEIVTVRIKNLSANALKVDGTKEGQIVKLIGVLSSTRILKSNDIECGNGLDSSNPKWVNLESQGDNFYRVTCTMPVNKTDQRGVYEAAIGIADDEDHIGWQMVPMTARYLIPNTFKDAFGMKRTENILGFTFESNPTFFATPLAVSPPSDYKVLPFEEGSDGYLIFDSADTEPLKPTVKFSKNKKAFSLNCPKPITKVSAKVKKQTMVALWLNKALYKPRGILGSTFEPNYYNNLEIPKSLKGKEVKVACSTRYVLPESNVILAYSESEEISVRFP
jgi:hypothetical protein